MIKRCSHCKQEKQSIEFNKEKATKDGLMYWCRECCKASHKLYRQTNSDFEKLRNKEYSKLLKGRFSRYKRQAKKDNREFSLTIEQFTDLTSRKCYYCNEYEINENYVGVDRINSNTRVYLGQLSSLL